MKKKVIIPPIITTIIILIVYAIKSLYPFGDTTIVHADLAQDTIYKVTYFVSNLRSGNFGALIYCNTLFAGTNLGYTLLFSPLEIAFLFCRNLDNVPYFLSFVLIIEVAMCSITSYICFKKLFGENNYKLNILFSVEYALSAFVLINYTTPAWIDIVMCFPLLILSLKKIIDEQKVVWYAIMICICFIINYQLTYMILFAILAISAIVLKYYVKPENRKIFICNLGVGTILGLVMGVFYQLPNIEIFLNSTRTDLSVTLDTNVIYIKLSYFLISSVCLFGFIKLMKFAKKDNNIKILGLAFLVTAVMPIAFEGINELWHGGSHDSFPFRYGFIPLFILNVGANYYYSRYWETERQKPKSKIKIMVILYSLILAGFYLFCACFYINDTQKAFTISKENCLLLVIYNIVAFFLLNDIMVLKKHKMKAIFCVALIEVMFFSWAYIGLDPDERGDLSHTDTTVFRAINIKNELADVLDYSGYRYKDSESLFIENTSEVSNLPSISSWLLNTEEQSHYHRLLGYGWFDMKESSAGGTLLSDVILGVRYNFAMSDLDEELYTYLGESSDGIKLYEYNNYLSMGIIYDGDTDISSIDSDSMYDWQNLIYRNLFGKDDDILEIISPEYETKNITVKWRKFIIDKLDNTLTYEIEISGNKELYFYADNMNNASMNVYVNGEPYYIHSISSYENTAYPISLNNSILDLGRYEDETVTVMFCMNSDARIDDFNFALLDIDKYKEICNNDWEIEYSQEGATISYYVNNTEENKKLFIPTAYDDNWVATVNGKEVEIEKVLGTFMSVELEEGENYIELKVVNKTIWIGIAISVVGVILLILYAIFGKHITKSKIIQNIAWVAFIIVDVAFYAYVYGYGIVRTFLMYL